MTPEQASQKYHWMKYDRNTNTIEMYLDHYMLSGARLCEARFYLEHILQISPRYTPGARKPWFLDWGEYVHFCVEVFYLHFKVKKCPINPDKWLKICKEKWDEMKMDEYGGPNMYKSDRDKYEGLGGWVGAAGFLVQYYSHYMNLNVRVVDCEISFGYNKEVYLGSFTIGNNDFYQHDGPAGPFGAIPRYFEGQAKAYYNVKCYLTGRIDLLVDNGYKVGPVDHKSTNSFDGSEHLDFNPHDGITGYILVINELLKRYRDIGLTNLPRSSGGWIYHLSTTIPSVPRDKSKKQGPRFKATPVDKTPEQLKDYKARNLSTFKRISELVLNNKVPEWNTTTCNNIFFRQCQYFKIHEQPSSEWATMIKQFYIVGEDIWDTRKLGLKGLVPVEALKAAEQEAMEETKDASGD